jgi:hypothetical protein
MLTTNIIDAEFERICECGNYYQNGRCPSDACETLRAHGYREDEELHAFMDSGNMVDAVERMNKNIKNAKRNNSELFN